MNNEQSGFLYTAHKNILSSLLETLKDDNIQNPSENEILICLKTSLPHVLSVSNINFFKAISVELDRNGFSNLNRIVNHEIAHIYTQAELNSQKQDSFPVSEKIIKQLELIRSNRRISQKFQKEVKKIKNKSEDNSNNLVSILEDSDHLFSKHYRNSDNIIDMLQDFGNNIKNNAYYVEEDVKKEFQKRFPSIKKQIEEQFELLLSSLSAFSDTVDKTFAYKEEKQNNEIQNQIKEDSLIVENLLDKMSDGYVALTLDEKNIDIDELQFLYASLIKISNVKISRFDTLESRSNKSYFYKDVKEVSLNSKIKNSGFSVIIFKKEDIKNKNDFIEYVIKHSVKKDIDILSKLLNKFKFNKLNAGLNSDELISAFVSKYPEFATF